jgi:small membrane protein
MFQQAIALIVIFFFIFRLFLQKRKKTINTYEFFLWFLFWSSTGVAIIFIKQIDSFVARIGFSGSGIDVLIYLSVIILFYFVLKLRMRLEKQERNITKIIRNISINNK